MGWPAELETGKSNITDREGARDTAGESTDAEIVWHTDTRLMISSDQEKLCLDGLAQEQDRSIDRAL